MPEATPANRARKKLRKQLTTDYRDICKAALTKFVLEESDELEPGLGVDASFYQRLQRAHPELYRVLPEDMRILWFCTDFKEIIDTSGTSPRAQMLSEKWKENKRKERKERKELKINAPPLKQRPRLPPSLDGAHSPTKSAEALLKKYGNEGLKGEEGAATEVLKEVMRKLQELGAAGYKTPVEGSGCTVVAVYQVGTYDELTERLMDLKAKVEATPRLRSTFAAFDESADVSDLMKLENDLFQHMERQRTTFETYTAGLEALREGLQPLMDWAGQLSESMMNPRIPLYDGTEWQEDGAGGEASQGKMNVEENGGRTEDMGQEGGGGEEDDDNEEQGAEEAADVPEGPPRKKYRLTMRGKEAKRRKNQVAKVAETRLRAVTHVVVMVSRFVHTELTAVNRAYKETHTLDHEVHEKVIELITGITRQVAVPPKEASVAFLDLL